MEPNHINHEKKWIRAHVSPFVLFMGFVFLLSFIDMKWGWDHPDAPWWRKNSAFFGYPLQVVLLLGVLIYYWREYDWKGSWKSTLYAVLFGAIGIGFWLLPTTLYDFFQMNGKHVGWLEKLGFTARNEGFNPYEIHNPYGFWFICIMRFLRAIVVVALIEEIFWRGFLMRFLNNQDGDYWKEPFGKHSWLSYAVVTAAFMMVHAPVDWLGAWIYGSLTYVLAIWQKSLGACVVMHATANAIMCIYIMMYDKFGLW